MENLRRSLLDALMENDLDSLLAAVGGAVDRLSAPGSEDSVELGSLVENFRFEGSASKAGPRPSGGDGHYERFGQPVLKV